MIKESYTLLEKKWDKKNRIFFYRAVKLYLNVFYPIFIKFSPRKSIDLSSDIIVSLTTFPARVDYVHLSIETILRQTVRPQKIILWLSQEQFEGRKLPRKLTRLKKYGLEIAFCDDLKSHKKYYYSMIRYPNNKILTIDDDTLYPEDLIEKLLNKWKLYPDVIVTTIAHQIRLNPYQEIANYNEWNSMVKNIGEPSIFLMPVGCEGVLYPPNSLCKEVFNKEIFMNICKNADDLWLKSMSLLCNTRVITTSEAPIVFVNIMKTQKFALNKLNNGKMENDEQLKNILIKYPKVLEILCREAQK